MIGDYPEISFRTRDAGGDVRNSPLEAREGAFRRARNITLLVHGFNTNITRAREAYAAMAKNLPVEERETIFHLFWPGDVTESRLSSGLRYAEVPNRARDCADMMAEFMMEEFEARADHDPSTTEVRIIAHSLGCRLALELCQRLRFAGGYKVKEVVLMAAAVPRYMAANSGRFNLGKTGGKDGTLVLHSKKDKILFAFFKTGQRYESEYFEDIDNGRAALGRFGLQGLGIKKGSINEEKTEHDHSDYWTSPRVSQSIINQFKGPVRNEPRKVGKGRNVSNSHSVQGRMRPQGRRLG